jgi:transposase
MTMACAVVSTMMAATGTGVAGWAACRRARQLRAWAPTFGPDARQVVAAFIKHKRPA